MSRADWSAIQSCFLCCFTGLSFLLKVTRSGKSDVPATSLTSGQKSTLLRAASQDCSSSHTISSWPAPASSPSGRMQLRRSSTSSLGCSIAHLMQSMIARNALYAFASQLTRGVKFQSCSILLISLGVEIFCSVMVCNNIYRTFYRHPDISRNVT